MERIEEEMDMLFLRKLVEDRDIGQLEKFFKTAPEMRTTKIDKICAIGLIRWKEGLKLIFKHHQDFAMRVLSGFAGKNVFEFHFGQCAKDGQIEEKTEKFLMTAITNDNRELVKHFFDKAVTFDSRKILIFMLERDNFDCFTFLLHLGLNVSNVSFPKMKVTRRASARAQKFFYVLWIAGGLQVRFCLQPSGLHICRNQERRDCNCRRNVCCCPPPPCVHADGEKGCECVPSLLMWCRKYIRDSCAQRTNVFHAAQRLPLPGKLCDFLTFGCHLNGLKF